MILLKIKKIALCLLYPNFYRSYINGVCPLFETKDILKDLEKVDLLLDVGSNKGQFSILFNYYFPNSKIYSFEPQIKYLNIQKKILSNKSKFFNLCLGNKDGFDYLNITDKEDSSSILEPNILKKSIYKIIDKIKIKVTKLDTIIKLPSKKNIFLKLDVQGYEKNVLMGSKKNLSRIKYILIELSSHEIYKKQHTLKDISLFLKKNNFKLIKIINKSFLAKNINQADYFFCKLK